MTNSSQIIERIGHGRIIAIIRGNFQGRELDIASVLIEAGITAIEFTLNSPGALNSVKVLADRYGSQIAVGAGTVLKPQEVKMAADHGAAFIVSPNRNISVIAETVRLGMVSVPGCFTPSEVIEALDAGAHAIKLFPAISLGPRFVRALRGPLGDSVKLVPTGLLSANDAAEYFAAGAWAIGAGTDLVSGDAITEGGLARLSQRAKAFRDAVIRR